jgi:Fuc2NAc and GlcNAc transferase
MNNAFYQLIIGAVCSYFLVLVMLPYLQKNLIDTPNQRSSHQLPTPRGGGISFVISGTILTFIFNTGSLRWIPILCLPLAIIGLVDDYRDVPPLSRYLMQTTSAIILVLIARFTISPWEIIVYSLLITAIINFFNFMDGLDGLLACCSIPILAASSGWALAGSVLGFLLWNWSPAKVFMGDVGSTFLGAVFAGIAFQQTSVQDTFSLILLGFPLFADTSICIVRRFLNKQNVFQPHKQHLYQRLNQAGWSHAKVSCLYLLAVILIVFIRGFGNMFWVYVLLLIELLIGFLLDFSAAARFKSF